MQQRRTNMEDFENAYISFTPEKESLMYNANKKTNLIISPRAQRCLIIISFLFSVYLFFANMEWYPVCTDGSWKISLLNNVPFYSELNLFGGQREYSIINNIMEWLLYTVYSSYMRLTWLCALSIFAFFMVTKNVAITWKISPWAKRIARRIPNGKKQ